FRADCLGMVAAGCRADGDGGPADLLDPLPVLAPAGHVQLTHDVGVAGHSLVAFYPAGLPARCHGLSPSGSVSPQCGRAWSGAGMGRGRVPCSLVRTSFRPPRTRVQPVRPTASPASPTATTSPFDSDRSLRL